MFFEEVAELVLGESVDHGGVFRMMGVSKVLNKVINWSVN